MGRININDIRREQIVQAGRRLVAEKGWLNVSIRDIAAEAGVSRGVITYHFKDKDDIIASVLAAVVFDLNELLDEAFAARPDDPLYCLRALAAVLMRMAREKPDYFFVLFNYFSQASYRPDLRGAVAELFRSYRHSVAEMIERGITAGQFRPLPAEAAATVITAMLIGAGTQYLMDPEQVDPLAAQAEAEQAILAYLQGR